LTLASNRGILQYMKNFTTFQSRTASTVRHLSAFSPDGVKWQVTNRVGKFKFFPHLTDALMYAEGVHRLDDLSSEARQYWNLVAICNDLG